MPSIYLTTSEAARRIGIGPRTLTRRLRRGDDVPPVVRIGTRTLRWPSDGVDAWVRLRTEGNSGNRPRKATEQGDETMTTAMSNAATGGNARAITGSSEGADTGRAKIERTVRRAVSK